MQSAFLEALTNLISNALRYGAATRLSVGVGQNDSEAWISVCDDGSGIPLAERARLLTPFEVGYGKSSGTGLGLTIAAEQTPIVAAWNQET